MICSEKERESCNVEKLGCNGCFYRELTNEEIEQCIKDLTKVRPEMLDDEALKLFKTTMQILDERDNLRKENANFKEIEAEHKKINKELRTQNKKAIDRLKEYLKMIRQDGIYGYDTEIVEILSILKR